MGYSTAFTGGSPTSVAVDATGSAYVGGSSRGTLPITPGAYQPNCNCIPISTGFLEIILESGFATKFDPTGSTLIYSTYVGGTGDFLSPITAFARASEGSVYVAGSNGIVRLNATGTALLATAVAPKVNPSGDGGCGGRERCTSWGAPGSGTAANQFHDHGRRLPARACRAAWRCPPKLGRLPPRPSRNWTRGSQSVLAATYFGGPYDQASVIALDSAGLCLRGREHRAPRSAYAHASSRWVWTGYRLYERAFWAISPLCSFQATSAITSTSPCRWPRYGC